MRRMTGLSIKSLFLLITITYSCLVVAGEYVLQKMENIDFYPGEVKEVCAAYVENLNKFNEPLVCDRKIHASMSAFSKPQWESIDPVKYPELLDELAFFWVENELIVKRIKEKDKNNKVLYYKKRLHKRAKAGALVWHLGQFDLDNDGKKDIVLHTQSIEYQCDPKKNFVRPSHGKVLILKKENGLHIDMEVTKYIYLSSWNVFHYKGSTFFDIWRGRADGKNAQITVYYPKRVLNSKNIGRTLVCWITYNTD